MKRIFALIVMSCIVSVCLVSAHEFYMGSFQCNDVEKVIVAPRKLTDFKFEKYAVAPSDLQKYTFQYIVVRSNGKVFSTFSDDFITSAPIVDGKMLPKAEKDKYLKD